ncbi:TetR/AcrR family transcriptional regulator [Solirubrobacter phytolaccae]|uniref:TetR/AcrR family transcriptional regulator n=1 Tax=Solirubrobacter phytolaccae TaxID=1404360 RepID=A0A9X3NAL4_9ACTN|nr:TetR/AcrR family transcriptional regulator [Solirubrobacter phytolaccae]MDA0181539.1 TetR/AcrR family transcriptional regulator [Solirubrobacter phytolaccae]
MSSEAQRQQVLRGVADAIAAKGYSATTIADIAKAARASRTTVYAQFPDKDSALIALHQEFGARVVEAVLDAHRAADGAWRDRLAAMVGAYVEALASASDGERASLLEVASIGPAGRASRQDGQDRFAAVVVEISIELAAQFPELRPLSPPLALGAVAAINELALRADDIRAVAPVATDFLERLVSHA